MSKHTPGPWIAPREQVNFICRKADYEDQQLGALANGFQATVSLKQGEARAMADALLISLAPEMLALLERALADVRSDQLHMEILELLEKVEGK